MITLSKRGHVHYGNTTIGGRRCRFSLGTRDKRIATKWAGMLDYAIQDGPMSDAWSSLRLVLPPETVQTLTRAQIGPLIPPSLDEVKDRFIEKMDRLESLDKMSHRTVANYERSVKRFINWLAQSGVRIMDEVTKPMLERWLAHRKTEIQADIRSTNGAGLLYEASAVKLLLKFCAEEKIIAASVQFPELPRASAVESAKPFTAQELEAMQSAAEAMGWFPNLAFLIFRWTGMRGADVASLQWADVDMDAGLIRKVTQKRKRPVEVPIHPDLKSVLLRREAVADPRLTDTVLPSATRESLYRLIAKIGTKCGIISDVHPHRFRASLVMWLLDQGVSVFEVSKIVGDTVETIENHYAKRLSKEMLSKVANVMEGSAA